jgi:hypothetical protein
MPWWITILRSNSLVCKLPCCCNLCWKKQPKIKRNQNFKIIIEKNNNP